MRGVGGRDWPGASQAGDLSGCGASGISGPGAGVRDHGGGVDAAAARWGGPRAEWLDLSTGINPRPYPLPDIPAGAWTALPDSTAEAAMVAAARRIWNVPEAAAILAAPGASALIARLPAALAAQAGNGGWRASGMTTASASPPVASVPATHPAVTTAPFAAPGAASGAPATADRTGVPAALPASPPAAQAVPPGPAVTVTIPGPTYNEHAAAFRSCGWAVAAEGVGQAQVVVHPNNPDGRLWRARDLTAPQIVIDESFCDAAPDASLIHLAARPGTVVLKSFGKFWGLAGLRLGFVIGDPAIVAALREALGPWPVSGPALAIGTAALVDRDWARRTRERLAADADRLDALMAAHGPVPLGGTTLFRLYDCDDAPAWHDRLARGRVWSRVFPYSPRWLRLGLPPPDRWAQLESALK